ncbi:hypothetical protein ACMGEZ_24000 [Variovorax sp. DT-64]
MLESIAIMLLGGWYPGQAAYHLSVINQLLVHPGLDILLADIPKEEANELRHDMHVMKLI